MQDSTWVNDAECVRVGLPIETMFVDAGHVIDDDVLEVCRRCPVRAECLTHAYDRGHTAGYFGGMSPGLRKKLPLTDALDYIANDPPQTGAGDD